MTRPASGRVGMGTGRVGLLLLASAAAMLIAFVGVSQSAGNCTSNWTGDAGDGLWTSADNWSGDSVPGTTSAVCISLSGSFDVDVTQSQTVASLTLGGAGSSPTLAVGSGVALDVNGSTAALTLESGTIDNSGTVELNASADNTSGTAGSASLEGGSTSGNPVVLNNDAVDASGSGSGQFVIQGNLNSLTGDVGAGYTLALTGEPSQSLGNVGGTAVLAVNQSVTNDGTIDLTTSDQGGEGAEIDGSGTLTNDGTLDSEQTAVGAVDVALDNAADGSLEANSELVVGVASGSCSGTLSFTEDGSVTVASGQDLYVGGQCASQTTFAGGTIDNGGTFEFNEDGDNSSGTEKSAALTLQGGTNSGTPIVLNNVALDASGNGTGQFTVQGNVNSLTGNVGAGYTLALTGEPSQSLGNVGGTAVVAVNQSVSDYGMIALTDSASGNDAEIDGSGTLTNDGVIESEQSVAGQTVVGELDVDLDNAAAGALDAQQELVVAGLASGTCGSGVPTFTQDGAITVAAATDLYVGGVCASQTTLAGGAIDNAGTFEINEDGDNTSGIQISAAVTLQGGVTSGTPVVFNNVALNGAGSGTETFEMQGNANTLTANIGSGYTIDLTGEPSATLGDVGGTAVLTADANVSNDGTIVLTSSDQGGEGAEVDGGGDAIVTNDGTIRSVPGAEGELAGSVTNGNGGTIAVDGPMQTVSASFVNDGALDTASGQTLVIGSNSTFTIAGGTIDNAGTITEGALGGNGVGGFAAEGGQATGNPIVLVNVGASFAGSGSGTFELHGTRNTLAGNIGAGYTVDVSGGAGDGTAELTASASFTNSGTLALTDPDPSGSGQSTAELLMSSGTLTNAGQLVSSYGTAGLANNSVSGAIDNDGTITVDQPLTQTAGTLTNDGDVSVAAGETFTLAGAYAQVAGTTGLAGTLDAPAGFNLEGGSLTGTGTLTGDLQNAGTVAPGPAPATLSIDGTYTQAAGGTLDASVTSTGSDELSVSGAATLDGTLQVSTATGFTPTVGTQYQVLSASSVSGQFATEAGLGSGPYSLSYSAGGATLTALTPPAVTLPTITISDPTVQAPAYGDAPATFTVTLSSAQSSAVTVDYATANGSAVAGSDYVANSGQLTFTPGQTTQTVTVQVIGGTLGAARTFLVELSDPSGATLQSASATGTITHPSASVSGVNPASGGDAGTVTVTIQGSNLSGAPTVQLMSAGQPTITASSVTVVGDGTALTATFDLNGAATGVRSVVVTDGAASETLANAFTVVPAAAPAISVQLAGPPAIAPGIRWSGQLLYSNGGNVDAYGTVIEIGGLPQGTDVQVTGATGDPIESDEDGIRTVTFTLGQIPASSSGAVGISFVAAGPTHATAYLQAGVLATSADPADGPSADVTITPTITKDTATELAGTLDVESPSGGGQISVDMQLVAPPSDGQPQITTTTSGGKETITELVPQAPSPGEFEAGSVAGGEIAIGTGTILSPVSVESSARAARADGILPRRASRDGVIDWVRALFSGVSQFFGVLNGAASTYSASQVAGVQRSFDACLAQSGILDPGRQGILDGVADGQVGINLLSTLGSVAGGVAGGVPASLGAQALSSGATPAWEANVFKQIQFSNSSNTSSVAVTDPLTGLPVTTVNGANVAQLFTNLGNNPAFVNCLKKHNCSLGGATGSGQRLAHDDGDLTGCPVPPPPPPFPIQLRTSVDPNGLIGPSGAGARHWLPDKRRPYTYTAMFQNEPTASAPAFQVAITDRLSAAQLDLATFRLGPIRIGSHLLTPPAGAQSWSTMLDLRPAQDILVSVSAALDRGTGVVTWLFKTINASTGAPVTDAVNGFLPPDTAPPAGDGSVSFSVEPNALKTGEKIGNGATIVFDDNAPINTPKWVNEIDGSRPTSRIASVKRGFARITAEKGKGKRRRVTHRRVPILTVRWKGMDRYSGVAGYALDVARARSRFHRLVTATSSTRAKVECKAPGSLRFYVVATSAVGTVQRGHSAISKTVRCP